MSVYSIIALIGSLGTFSLGSIVFLKNFKSKINRTFFFFSLSIASWLGFTFILLQKCDIVQNAIFWDKIVYMFVVFIPATCFHFSRIFVYPGKKKLLIVLGYSMSLFFLFTIFTDRFVSDLVYYPWGCHTKAGLFHHFFLINFAIFVSLAFRDLLTDFKKLTGEKKQERKYILIAFGVLALGVFGFLPAYGINVPPFIYISGFVSVIILTYAIFKHHLMNTKVIATEIFSVLIVLTIFVETLLSETIGQLIFRVIILFAVSVSSFLIIRSVLKEIKDKERIAKISEDLRRANIELKRLDKAKSEFVSIASHQLRTPLTAIKGYSSMILEEDFGKAPELIKSAVEKIFQSSQRLVFMVNDFLDISKIETGRMTYAFAELNLDNLVKNTVNELSMGNKKAKDLKLGFITNANDIKINGDANKIRQVIANLIDNALKYTEKGYVKVFLEKEKDRNVVLVKIEDSGIGFAPEMLPRLFRKFSRASNVSLVHTDGSGLGLYVAKRIIEHHKGKIWAESKGVGRGSTFYVELPVS